MGSIPWMIIATVAALIIAGVLAAFFSHSKRTDADYRGLFSIGLIWTAIGVIFYLTYHNIAFVGMGLVFMALGAAKKDEWRKQGALPRAKKKMMIGLVALTAVLVLLTTVASNFS